jgi:hypothetical protein
MRSDTRAIFERNMVAFCNSERGTAAYTSYASGTLTFDSVIFANCIQCMGPGFRGLPAQDLSEIRRELFGTSKAPRKVAAALAHRTMRIERSGPYSEERVEPLQ